MGPPETKNESFLGATVLLNPPGPAQRQGDREQYQIQVSNRLAMVTLSALRRFLTTLNTPHSASSGGGLRTAPLGSGDPSDQTRAPYLRQCDKDG